MEPIVADGQGKRHFRGVQVMGGIPIAELGDLDHLVDGAANIALITSHLRGHGEKADTLHSPARNAKKPEPVDDSLQRRNVQEQRGFFSERGEDPRGGGIRFQLLPDALPIPCGNQQARVRRKWLRKEESG